MASAVAAGLIEVEPEATVAFGERVGSEAAADGGACWGAVFKVKAAIVLGAFDDLAFDESVGEVGIAVSANTIGGVQGALGIANEGVGFVIVIEADDIFGAEVRGVADIEPAIGIGLRIGCEGGIIGLGAWWRELTFDVESGIFDLLGDGGENFLPARPEAGIRGGAIVLDGGV